MNMKDVQYYDAEGFKAIDIIEAYKLDFALANVIKYVLRAGKKTQSPLTDLKKARDYLQFRIDQIEKAEETWRNDLKGLAAWEAMK